jgi:hypothetical protein
MLLQLTIKDFPVYMTTQIIIQALMGFSIILAAHMRSCGQYSRLQTAICTTAHNCMFSFSTYGESYTSELEFPI